MGESGNIEVNIMAAICKVDKKFKLNPLTPNETYSGRTAPLTSKVAFIYLFNKYTY